MFSMSPFSWTVKRPFRFLLFLVLLFPSFLYAQTTGETDLSPAEIQKTFRLNENRRIRDSIKIRILEEELEKAELSHRELLSSQQAEIQQDSASLLEQLKAIEALRPHTRAVPVLLYIDTVFCIYTSLGPFTAVHRAENASQKIYDLYEQASFDPDLVVVTPQQNLLNIQYNNTIVTSLSVADALWAGKDLNELAAEYQQNIRTKILDNRESHSLISLLTHIGYSLIVILVLVIVLWLQNISIRKLQHWVSTRKGDFFKAIKIKNHELFAPRHFLQIVKKVLMFIKSLATIVLIYLSLSLIFSFFPETRNWTHMLLSWVVDLLKEIALSLFYYLPSLFRIIVIVLIVRGIVKLLHFFSMEIERGVLQIKSFHPEWAQPTYNIIRFLLYAFCLVVIFPYLPGSDSTAFKGVSVFLGILFSIGSSSAIANTVAGLVITYMRPFKTGDWIKVNGITGYVVEKTALVTRLRTINNEDVTIPNSAILAHHTINYSSSSQQLGLVLTAEVSIRYEENWKTVHELLLKAAHATKDLDFNNPPYIFQTMLNEQNVSYQLNVHTKKPERMYHIHSDLCQNILSVFDEAGIDISIPKQITVKESGETK